MTEQTELLREIRDLLRVIAEPGLAARDAKPRESLARIVGRSPSKGKAVLLMDGSRTQKAISEESGVDQGNLSKMVKALRDALLIGPDDKHPKLVISVLSNFFEKTQE